MQISIGTTLGRYEIRSLLGAGGMGEVYLAHDSQLRRLVALKFLPESLTRDEDRLRRFEQEAYAASGLNHPHILTIYEIGEVEQRRFIAMEYVEGGTLRQHMAQAAASPSPDGVTGASGMKLGHALDIAIQIASALAASQTAGIAHRDIKPDNIMIRRDGYIKVLDFGLAKLTERPETTDTEAPTRALVNTSPGAVMGTVNYMSPEQASAKVVDARTDIWSLGVVLYEMVTGRTPFSGPTPSHVIVAITDKDPVPLARYVSELPEALEWIVTKALTKDREDRYQTAREILTDLRRLKQRLDAGVEMERSVPPNTISGGHSLTTTDTLSVGRTLSAFPGTATQPGATPTISSAEYLATSVSGHKLVWAIGALALLLLLVGGAWLWTHFRHREPAAPFSKVRFTQLTNTGKATVATISPDGKYVVHVVSDGVQSSLWVRQTATSSNVQIVPPSETRYVGVTFSNDGNYVYYVVYEKNAGVGFVYQIPVLGGTPRKIIEDVDTPITFSADGKRFAWIRQFPNSGDTALFVANADGSGERKIASRQRPERYLAGTPVGPSWSPTEDLIAAPAAGLEIGKDIAKIVSVDINSGTEKEISAHRWPFVQQVVWMRRGEGLIITAQEAQRGPNQLWHIGYPGGEAERITNDLNNYNGVSISADGSTIATTQSQTTSSVWVTPNGKSDTSVRVTTGTKEGGGGVALMPDGRIIYTNAGSGSAELMMVDANGNNARPLTSNNSLNGLPAVSPDGRFIVFISNHTGGPHIWRMNSDGTGLKQLTDGLVEIFPTVSPDSQWIVYQNIGDLRLWKAPIDGGNGQQLTDKLASQAAISPNGKLVACRYRERELSPFQLAILAFEDGKTVKALDLPPSAFATPTLDWTPDGKAVLYVDNRGGISNIWSQPIDGGPARQVTFFNTDQIFAFDLGVDGKTLALARGNVSDDVVLIVEEKK
ncbi:MAG: protein kinase domain-containing protein [Pyrinomonadaceae bacterium]